ncbi:MAG: alpha/beta hydrolase [Piscinibacter sp.]
MPHSELPRLLVVPGLNDSGPGHWQTWLQAQHRDALRVKQRDWGSADLDRWSERIASSVASGRERGYIAVAHSFGCLALAQHLARHPDSPIESALLVAPAEPDRFGIGGRLPLQRLPRSTVMVASDTDPWMKPASAHRWAARWGSHFVNLGDAGHINIESGHGPLPLAARWVQAALQRAARERRPDHADWAEWSFAW